MATKNIVPRADGEGELGTSSKKWSKVQAVTGSFDHIQTTTMATEIYTSGSTKFGDTSDDTHQFTGSVLVNGDVTATTFFGDGSGLTGVTGDWDGQHTGDAGITGSLTIRDSDGITFQKGAGATIGNIKQFGGGDLEVNSVVNMILSSSNGDISIKPSATGKVEVTGDISASINISASAFYGDGSGLTGVTGDWDGQHTGDAGITGSLEVSQDITASNFVGALVGNADTADKVDVNQAYANANYRVVMADSSGTDYEQLYIDTALVYNPSTNKLTVADLSASINISASAFYGDGSGLTNLPAASWDGQLNGDAGITGSLDVLGNISASSDISAPNITASVHIGQGATINFENTGSLIWAKNTGQDLYLDGGRDVYIRPDRHMRIYTGTGAGTKWVEFDGTNQKVEVTGDISANGTASIGDSANPLAGINIYPKSTNQVTLDPKSTSGRINLGSISSQTIFFNARIASSIYPAATNYQFGTTGYEWGSIGAKRVTASLGIELGGQVHGSGNDIGEETSVNFDIDWDDGMTQELILSGAAATTLTASFDNVRPYATYQLIHKIGKDNMAIYFSDSIYWPGGTRPTLSTTSGSIDVLTFTTDGNSNLYGVAQYNFSASVG